MFGIEFQNLSPVHRCLFGKVPFNTPSCPVEMPLDCIGGQGGGSIVFEQNVSISPLYSLNVPGIEGDFESFGYLNVECSSVNFTGI